jgi:glycosyltransferase involved in cell wall biosynthesis
MSDTARLPLVSVVIPTWKRPTSLRRAIAGVVKQTYQSWELVVADEGGSEETEHVVGSFHDARIRYYRHESRLGFLGNWTFGVRHARAEWLAVLGDDDYYLPDFISNRIEVILRNPSVTAVTGTYVCRAPDDAELWRSPPYPCGERVVSGSDMALVAMSRAGEWFNGATLYRRQVVDEEWDRIVHAGTAIDLALNCRLATMDGASLGLLQRYDMVLTRHAGQESVTNQFMIGRGAAIFGFVMACADADRMRGRRGWRKWLATQVNTFARQNWDCGNVSASRALHVAELTIWPFRVTSWLRLVRSLILRGPRKR